jgi:hypothetical protein
MLNEISFLGDAFFRTPCLAILYQKIIAWQQLEKVVVAMIANLPVQQSQSDSQTLSSQALTTPT